MDGAPSGVRSRACVDGSVALDPLFRREVDGSGRQVGLWEQVDVGGCPEDGGVVEPVVLSGEEFRRLPLVASVPGVQPGHGRALVGVELIVFTEAGVQELSTQVLGVPVQVRASPVEFVWDFGDRSVVRTADAGAPFPRNTVGHVFSEPGEVEVVLSTTWAGQFRVQGDSVWQGVDGTAVTVSAPVAVSLEEARSRLVHDPLP